MAGTQKPEGYKDRSAGLVVFGLVVLGLGALCALMIPLAVLAQVLGSELGAEQTPWGTLVAGMCFYAILAVTMGWLGIGSMAARRWARSLLHVVAWLWLLSGLLMLPIAWIMMPSMLGQMAAPGSAASGELLLRLIVVSILGGIFVLVPGAMVLFYRRSDVVATCAARDPVDRWTDRCPPPVLSLVMLWGLSAVLLVITPAMGGAVPLFGILVRGPWALVILIAGAGLCVALARSTARLEPSSWWAAQIVVAVASLSALLTFVRQPVLDSWAAIGLGSSSLELTEELGVDGRSALVILTLLTWVFFGAFLIHFRRHFVGAEEDRHEAGCGERESKR